jgi:hypothetical protein
VKSRKMEIRQRSGLNYLKGHATSFEFVVLRKTTPLAVNKP